MQFLVKSIGLCNKKEFQQPHWSSIILINIPRNSEIAIIEMGANHQKEISLLSSICEPGYITNFGKAHLEGFGGIDGVIRGKSELYDYLRVFDQTAMVILMMLFKWRIVRVSINLALVRPLV